MKIFGFKIHDDMKDREADIRDAIYDVLINPRISVECGSEIISMLLGNKITLEQFYSYMASQRNDESLEESAIFANLDKWNKTVNFSTSDLMYLRACDETNQYLVKPTDIEGIVKYISERVIGQNKAIQSLVTAVWKHCYAVRNNIDIEVPAQLLIGPTGVGKTKILNTLSDLLDIPIINIFASTTTAPGYKGGDSFSDQIFSQISQYSIDTDTQPVIVFVHELDKAVCVGHNDNYNKELMSSIMSCIESTTIYKASVIGEPQSINLKNVLLLFDGCFDGIERIVERRLGSGRVGFNQIHSSSSINIRSLVTRADLREYGMSREFCGRISYPICLNPMNEDLLYDIITKSHDSPLKAHIIAFAKEGMELKLSCSALKIITKYLHNDIEFGARSINAVMDQLMRPYIPLLSKPVKDKRIVIGKKEVCRILGIIEKSK